MITKASTQFGGSVLSVPDLFTGMLFDIVPIGVCLKASKNPL